MSKLDLDAIIDTIRSKLMNARDYKNDREMCHLYMKEAIRQALVLASKKATARERTGLGGIWLEIDTQSILDVEKLII